MRLRTMIFLQDSKLITALFRLSKNFKENEMGQVHGRVELTGNVPAVISEDEKVPHVTWTVFF